MKTVRKNGNTAHFEAMFSARICSLSTKVRQSCFSDPFSLQSKQLQPDYESSHELFKYLQKRRCKWARDLHITKLKTR